MDECKRIASLRIFFASNKRGTIERRCNPFDRSNATQWQGITTFPDTLRIFARVIVTCLCAATIVVWKGRFFFFFFCKIVKSKNFFRRCIDSRIMETIFHWKYIHECTYKKEM